MCIIQRVSPVHHSLKAVSLKVAPTVGIVGQTHIPRMEGYRWWDASDCLGPAYRTPEGPPRTSSNTKARSTKFLEENSIFVTLKSFLRTQEVLIIKKIGNLNFIKIETFCFSKDIIKKYRSQVQSRRKCSQNIVLTKDMCPEYLNIS